MHRKAILLGPDGQLGRDVRRAHARFGNGIELIPLGRKSLDISARGAVESVLRGLVFDVLVNCAAYTAVDEAEGRVELAYSVNADAVRAMAKGLLRKAGPVHPRQHGLRVRRRQHAELAAARA